jgi:uncharacterized membrane protein
VTEAPPAAGARPGGRVDAIDCARGLALIGMAAFHLSWDLADFRLVSPILPFTPPMRLLSHIVASAFLALVGVSLALAHRRGIDLPAFWRRFAIVAGAAALVTAGSFVFAPGMPIWFGILHCIAAASLIALPFLRAPAAASLAAGAAMIALPAFVHSPAFDPPALLWLGLGEALPNTVDWRPLLPWAGATMLGLGVALLPAVMARLVAPGRWRAASGPTRAIALAGRHSLAIYLIHQPILIGLVWAAAALGAPTFRPPPPDPAGFLAACTRTCVANGRAEEDCDTRCRCVLDALSRSPDAKSLDGGPPDAAAEARLHRLANACMGRPEEP